jgi:hypothetical protein
MCESGREEGEKSEKKREKKREGGKKGESEEVKFSFSYQHFLPRACAYCAEEYTCTGTSV